MKNLFKRKLWIGTAIVLLAGTMLYGCDDFLNAPPQGSLDANTLSNANGVEGALIAAYRALDWNNGVADNIGGTSASNWLFGSVLSDDAYKGTEATDGAEITNLELYNWSTGNALGAINGRWRAMYEGVNRANAAIDLLVQVEENNPSEISDADANAIRGEALFLRAHYHFELWQMFGNIPYYTEEDEDFQKANIDADEVVVLILADLDEAISLLPDSPRNGHDGRVTSWSAKSYKGKVQLWSGNFAGTVTTLEDVVNNGPYELEENYHHVWTGLSQYYNGPETVFAFQASANDGEPNGNNANYGERLNFPHSGSPFGCCGFHQGSQNLVNFFKVDGNGLPNAMSNPSTVFDATAAWNAQDGEFDASFSDPVDPRLDWTVGRDGVPFKDWGAHDGSWIRQEAFGGPYSAKKNIHEQGSSAQSNVGWVNTQLNSVKIHILRYADVMLMLAEAYAETGNGEAARDLVNQIRTRAGAAAQGPGTDVESITVPIDDPSITWADYEIGLYPAGSFNDQAYAISAVRAERRLELGMEGTRFFDLKRWGIMPDVINDYVSVEQNRRNYLTAAANVTDRYYLFPIPPVQLELSQVEGESRLTQNPGW